MSSEMRHFDWFFDGVLNDKSTKKSYPRYNVSEIDDNTVNIEVLAPGLCKEDISIELQNSLLTIYAKGVEDSNIFYKEKGFSTKQFEISFNMGIGFKVSEAVLDKGILTIRLEKDTEKRTSISINELQ